MKYGKDMHQVDLSRPLNGNHGNGKVKAPPTSKK